MFHSLSNSFLINTFQQSLKVFMHSVCLFTYARFHSRKYFSNVLKFITVIHISYSMDSFENGIHKTNGSSRDAQKFSATLRPIREKIFKTYFKNL